MGQLLKTKGRSEERCPTFVRKAGQAMGQAAEICPSIPLSR